MTPAQCQAALARCARASDLALVEGHFTPPCKEECPGSELSTLCDWLDMPRLAIVDARLLEGCHLPNRPARLDGLLLDRVRDTAELCRLQTLFEALWNVPVVGWLGELKTIRGQVAALPLGKRPCLGLCHSLGNQFTQSGCLPRILELANREDASCWTESQPQVTHVAFENSGDASPHIAVAYDDAFAGYFPDALEALEARGARISDFSPLRDERLPTRTDIVYIGCGHPELFARELAANDCMILALKSHVCSGKRLYGEGGGLAYLCQAIEIEEGEQLPMAAILPAVARMHEPVQRPQPCEAVLSSDTWLGSTSAALRGYLNSRWSLTTHAEIDCSEPHAGHRHDLVRRNQVIGSRLHLNFATQTTLLDRFFTSGQAVSAVHGRV